jgi:hypothetical protein
MNESPLKPKEDHPLDRGAALMAIGVLQLAVLVLTPVIWKQRGGLEYIRLVEPWALSLASMTDFVSTIVPTHWARRSLVACASCVWVWSALICGHNLAGEKGFVGEIGSYWILNLVFMALASASIGFVLKLVFNLRLTISRNGTAQTPFSRQFRLLDLMKVVFLICVTLAAGRLAGPIGLPPTAMFRWLYVVNILTYALLGVAAILAPFSRKQAVLFAFMYPSLACFDVAMLLVLEVRVPQWTQYVPHLLKGEFIGQGIMAANCILTMLFLRWLGYRLEWTTNRRPAAEGVAD